MRRPLEEFVYGANHTIPSLGGNYARTSKGALLYLTKIQIQEDDKIPRCGFFPILVIGFCPCPQFPGSECG